MTRPVDRSRRFEDMKENLDSWIKNAKEITPDSGEYRRLNRALLKEHMLAGRSGRSRRHRLLGSVVVLVVLVLMSGQISQLGSDGFGTRKHQDVSATGDTVTYYTNEFRRGTTNLPADFTAADVEEFQQAVGLSYGGKTVWWKHTVQDINGKTLQVEDTPDSPLSQEPDDLVLFLETHMSDLIARCRTEAPHRTLQMEIDGIPMEFGAWTFEYEEFGEVTRYLGFPVAQD